MSQPSSDISQQNEVLNTMNARLTELAESETSVTVFCVYNDNRISGFGEVQLPLRFYQAHQHLLFQVHPGANDTQGQYVFVRYQRGDVFVHRMLIKWYLGSKACDGFQVHHKDTNCTNNSLDNVMLVTAKENSSARGPSRSTMKSVVGVKGVQLSTRKNRYIVEFQSGSKHTHPKITRALPLDKKEVAIHLYNKLCREFNGTLSFQNAVRALSEEETKLLNTEYDACIARYNKRKAVFDANGGRPTKKKRT
jgi:hypothetical protein